MSLLKLTKRNKSQSIRQNRSGVAAVEFAIVAPLLLLILFGMIETSRFLSARHAVTGAAREVARRVAVTGADQATAEQVAREFLDRSGFSTDSVEVFQEPLPSEVPNMRLVTVDVSISFNDVSLVGDPFNFAAARVQGFSSMLGPVAP